MESNEIIEDVVLKCNYMGYIIKSNGEVIGKRGNKLKLHKGASGYINVNIYENGKQTTYSLHRLLAACFIKNPKELLEVNHKDGNKENNSLNNLEWVSRSQNIQHGIDSGLIPSPWQGKNGSLHTRSKKVLQLDLIGNVLNEYGSAREAARLSGVNYGTISNVLIGRGKTAGGFKWIY